MPLIQQTIKSKYNIEPGAHLNGDEAMAHGAAVIAANYTSGIKVRPIWLDDYVKYEINANCYTNSTNQVIGIYDLFGAYALIGSESIINFRVKEDFKCDINIRKD